MIDYYSEKIAGLRTQPRDYYAEKLSQYRKPLSESEVTFIKQSLDMEEKPSWFQREVIKPAKTISLSNVLENLKPAPKEKAIITKTPEVLTGIPSPVSAEVSTTEVYKQPTPREITLTAGEPDKYEEAKLKAFEPKLSALQKELKSALGFITFPYEAGKYTAQFWTNYARSLLGSEEGKKRFEELRVEGAATAEDMVRGVGDWLISSTMANTEEGRVASLRILERIKDRGIVAESVYPMIPLGIIKKGVGITKGLTEGAKLRAPFGRKDFLGEAHIAKEALIVPRETLPLKEEPSAGKLQMEQTELLRKIMEQAKIEKPAEIVAGEIPTEKVSPKKPPLGADLLKMKRELEAKGVTEKPAPAVKEPWEMTRKEWSNLENKTINNESWLKKHTKEEILREEERFGITHSYAVKQALSEGKPVPPEVLADYPDLVKKAPTKGAGMLAEAPKVPPKAELHAGLHPKAFVPGLKIAKEQTFKVIDDLATRTLGEDRWAHKKYKTGETATALGRAIRTAKRSIQSPSRLFPEQLTDVIFKQQDAENVALAKYNVLMDKARDVGILTGSPTSRKAGLILDTDPYTLPAHKLVDFLNAEKSLNPAQTKMVGEMKGALNELADVWGLEKNRRISYYYPHIIEQSMRNGIDISDLLKSLPKELKEPLEKAYTQWLKDSDGGIKNVEPPEILKSKNLFNRFNEPRKGVTGYSYDVAKVLPIYIRTVLRKAYRQPAIDQITPLLKEMVTKDPDMYDMANNWVNYYLGRNQLADMKKYPGLYAPLAKARNMIYRGALEGNFAAALLNRTQIFNTFSEIGAKVTAEGIRQFYSKEGQRVFLESGIMADYLHGRRPGRFDFFTRAEYWNRGITYLGERARFLKEGATPEIADLGAKKLVRKVQFWYGLDMPQVLRGQIGKTVAQFGSYPLKQTELILGWIKNKEWNKLGRFVACTYLVGGPKALIPVHKQLLALTPVRQEDKEKIANIFDQLEEYTSLAGWTGVNLAPKFGWGIFPSGPAPILAIGQHIAKGLATGDFSDLLSRDVPLAIPSGVQLKKMYTGGANILRGYTKTDRERKRYETNIPTELKRMMIGQPLKEGRGYKTIKEISGESKEYTKTRAEIIDMIIESEEKNKPELYDKAIAKLEKWYDDNPYQPMKITKNDILEEKYLKTLTSVQRKLYFAKKGLKIKYQVED
jgi:hypothetical protein